MGKYVIKDADMDVYKKTSEILNGIAKPLNSFGEFEELIKKMAALTGSTGYIPKNKTLIVLCADNGVVAKGVSQTGCDVTKFVADSLVKGVTASALMAKKIGCKLVPVDMGIKDYAGNPEVLDMRIANGTMDITEGPAMTEQQCIKAIESGIGLVKAEKDLGTDIIVTGEMGIGNTTTSAALASRLLNVDSDLIVGRGAGLSDELLENKKRAVKTALKVNEKLTDTALGALAALGGFDIAGMTGIFLGGAIYNIPIVIDGVISAVAALTACRMTEKAKKAMIPSHVSSEPAGKMLLDEIGLKPVITAGMHLGEGTGGLMLLPMLDLSYEMYFKSYRFTDTPIEQYKEY